MLIKVKKNLIREIFYFLSATLILFLVSEIFWPGSILFYLNINYLIAIWIITWLILL